MICGPSKGDRKSTRLNSSHANISYAVFCLKKKKRDYVDALELGGSHWLHTLVTLLTVVLLAVDAGQIYDSCRIPPFFLFFFFFIDGAPAGFSLLPPPAPLRF